MRTRFSIMTDADLAAIAVISNDAMARLTGIMDQPAFAGIMAFSITANMPIGYIAGFSLNGEADIIDLAVAKPYRRQGIARQLVTRFCDGHGQEMTHLEVAESNHPARRLYESLSFVETGRRREYYASEKGAAHADDAVRMTRFGNIID
jgi:ribosomal protein S18 acetylase RimI-like enzyme